MCKCSLLRSFFASRSRPRAARYVAAGAAFLLFLSAGTASAQSLRGSSSSLDRQNRQAKLHDFTFLRQRQEVSKFAGAGLLVPIEGNRDYRLNNVSFEVARPEVRLFLERLAGQYRRTCGTPLVVTSLTRPIELQPSNASRRSVHPTGMALDLRLPSTSSCRAWLERTLLHLEGEGAIDATLERRPAHYHVAVFPGAYMEYVAAQTGRAVAHVVEDASGDTSHTVLPKETLWRISKRYGTTLEALQAANQLESTDIQAGQVLIIP